VVENARTLAATLIERGYAVVSGGTDNHLFLLDLRAKNLTGKIAEEALSRAHITCNKNGIPFDPEKPTVTSGVRLGTAAATSRGFGVPEFRTVGNLIADMLDAVSVANTGAAPAVERKIRQRVAELTKAFPIYPLQ